MYTLWVIFLIALPMSAAAPRISYATYLGGSGGDTPSTIATDADGNYYVAAQTNSPNYPRLPAGQSFPGDLDIVVSKFSAANALVYSTVIGGSGVDSPYEAVVDTDGSLYLSFGTVSTNFPLASTTGTGVLKLNPAGTLTAVAILGGTSNAAYALTLDSNRRVWIAGAATGFSGQTGAIQASVAGGTDIFIARFNSALTQVEYFTYLGTTVNENANRIAVDRTGNVYVSGNGGSPSFPTGTSRPFPGAGSFVVKLDPIANRVLFATYLSAGGGGGGLIADGADVWAIANSTGASFVPTTDAPQSVYGGGATDAALIRLNATDGVVRYATYFGGSGNEFANFLARDASGNLVLIGNTTSANLPVTADAVRRTPGAATTAYVAEYDAGGRLLYASYLGGTGSFDFGLAVAADPAGNVIAAGSTTSTDFPTGAGAFQSAIGGAQDVYIARIEFAAANEPSLGSAAIQNAASFRGGAIAPGEVITIYPANAGPAALVTAALTADRRVSTLIGATRVLFDDTPAPMVYAVRGQISLVVPYAVAGKAFTRIVVEFNGTKSRPVAVPVSAVAPGIFTIASGTGPAALVNQDGSVNSPQNAAERNSIVVFFATGEGQTNPPGVDGRLNEFQRLEDFPQPVQTPRVTIGGVPAEILLAAGAPGFLAGLMQFNVRVPQAAVAGPAVPLEISIGGVTSQPGVTLAVR